MKSKHTLVAVRLRKSMRDQLRQAFKVLLIMGALLGALFLLDWYICSQMECWR